MEKVWITYAWEDNKNNEVDFIAQELEKNDIQVKLDKWDISAGRPLWEQIENFIQSPQETNAWLMYATQNSLSSQACKEEYLYALDRALHTRGADFPIIAIFPSTIDQDLIPAGIRVRLYVSTSDREWIERITTAIKGHNPNITKPTIAPYIVKVYENPTPERNFAIELRPRGGSWSPFIAVIPIAEKEDVKPSILPGPANTPPKAGMLSFPSKGPSEDGLWWTLSANNEATPTQSYYLFCDTPPSRVIFGQANSSPQYEIRIEQNTVKKVST